MASSKNDQKMDNAGKPVKDVEHIKKAVQAVMDGVKEPVIDFSNTENAFAGKTDKELKKAAWLFGLMNNHWLVGIGSKVGAVWIEVSILVNSGSRPG